MGCSSDLLLPQSLNLTEILEDDFCIISLGKGKILIGLAPFKFSESITNDNISFYLQDFKLTQRAPWVTPSSCYIVERERFSEVGQGTNIKAVECKEDYFREYIRIFDKVKENIADSKIEKAVPFLFKQFDILSGDPRACLSYFAKAPKNLHPYAFCLRNHFDRDYFVAGVSPEILFKKEANSRVLVTEAVAGTTTTINSELLLSMLNYEREQALVVDDLKSVLQRFGKVEVSSTSFQSYPSLMHLKSEISATFDEFSKFTPDDLVNAIHPTGAIGVIPRVSFEDKIFDLLDPMKKRFFYGAPFGVYIPEECGIIMNATWMFTVMIRNIQIIDAELLIGAGGGIVKESQLVGEWNELESKWASVQKLFFESYLSELS